MSRRSATITISVWALIAGSILNLAVAWACVWWQRPILYKGQVESARASDEAKALWTEVFGPSVFVESHNASRDIDPATVPRSSIHGSMIFFVFENRTQSLGMERWWIFDMLRPVAPGVRIVYAGLPMQAFGCRLVSEPATSPPRSDFERGGFTVRRGNGMVELPWRPLWLGFAVNTMLYSMLVACGLFIARMIRRACRRRRGVCVECAYPVGVSAACSECGAAI